MMSSTGPPSSVAVYTTRGSAVAGLCTYNGCSWKIYAGVNTYVCCCNQNLCNGASIAPTTPRPVSNTCYYCSTCPLPFTKNSALVTYATSANGWCTVSLFDFVFARISSVCFLLSENEFLIFT